MKNDACPFIKATNLSKITGENYLQKALEAEKNDLIEFLCFSASKDMELKKYYL